jgi:hypothetical protein
VIREGVYLWDLRPVMQVHVSPYAGKNTLETLAAVANGSGGPGYMYLAINTPSPHMSVQAMGGRGAV